MINDVLKSQLEILAHNDLMLKAIKALFDEEIEKNKPQIERTDNDKILGEKYRAYEQAKNLLNSVFIDIETYNTSTIKASEINRAK